MPAGESRGVHFIRRRRAMAAKKQQKGKRQQAAKAKAPKEGMSMIEAARKVLAEKGEPMTCRDMIEAMASRGYWKSPCGLTPHNTLYSAVLRLIQRDGKQAAFKKEDRGLFTLNASATA